MLKLGVILLAAGIVTLYFQSFVQEKLTKDECLNVTLLAKADEAIKEGSVYMCDFLCPCNYEVGLLALYTPTGRRMIKGSALNIEDCQPCENYAAYTAADKITVSMGLAAAGMTLAECQSYSSSDFVDQYFSSDQRMLFPLLSWVEETFDCSGLCTPAGMYVFSDVNNALEHLPTEACVEPLHDWVGEKFPIFGGVGVAIGAFMLLLAVVTCCLCCHK